MERSALALVALAAVLLGCSSAGGGTSCTLLGCTNGFDLRFSPDARWPAGSYRFELVADGGAKQICTGDLPLPPCTSGRALTCYGGTIATIGESGCALAATEHGFSGITFSGKPTKVRVIVQRGGAAFLDREFTPTYVTSRPNGPSCEPVCTNANETVTLTF